MNWLLKLFSSVPEPEPEPELETDVYCVPQCIACAWAMAVKKKLPVRIAISKIDIKENRDHSQAEVYYKNKWRPLIMKWTPKGPVTLIGNRHFPVEPYRHLPLTKWVDEQIKYTQYENYN